MTISELQAENERLKAERDYCQRYYHDVVVEAKRLKAERDAALRSVQVLMESSADNLRLAVTRERERDALTITSEESRGLGADLVAFDGQRTDDVTSLAEALRRTRRELPCKAIDEVVDEALSSTDARQWLREQRAEELQALKTTDLRGTVEVYAKNGCPYDEDVIYVSAIDARIAELRREET